jgi:hypothetical protein
LDDGKRTISRLLIRKTDAVQLAALDVPLERARVAFVSSAGVQPSGTLPSTSPTHWAISAIGPFRRTQRRPISKSIN